MKSCLFELIQPLIQRTINVHTQRTTYQVELLVYLFCELWFVTAMCHSHPTTIHDSWPDHGPTNSGFWGICCWCLVFLTTPLLHEPRSMPWVISIQISFRYISEYHHHMKVVPVTHWRRHYRHEPLHDMWVDSWGRVPRSYKAMP